MGFYLAIETSAAERIGRRAVQVGMDEEVLARQRAPGRTALEGTVLDGKSAPRRRTAAEHQHAERKGREESAHGAGRYTLSGLATRGDL